MWSSRRPAPEPWPLFPEGYVEEIQFMTTVLSFDGAADPNVVAMIGAFAAIAISPIPFLSPLGACRVGYIGGKIVINPDCGTIARRESDLNLIIAAMAAFLIRQPLTIAVKIYAGRRAKEELPAARFWTALYGVIALFALIGLLLEGFGYIFYLAVPAVPVFAWHLWLVSRREERRQAGIEIVATGVLV